MPELSFELDRAYAVMTTDHGDESATDRLYRLWYHEQHGLEHRFPWGSGYHATIVDHTRFEPGWRIVGRVERAGAPHAWKVAHGERERVVACPDIVPESMLSGDAHAAASPLEFAVDMVVAVNPLSCASSGGFWHLHSPRWEAEGPVDPRARVYFSIMRGEEFTFVERFARSAPLDINWAMKILCGPGPAGRRDSAVAYVPAESSTTTGWLCDLIEALDGLVDGATPPGTVPIRNGVAWAPELSSTKSFGQLMCDVLVDISDDTNRLLDRNRWTDTATKRLHELVAAGSQS